MLGLDETVGHRVHNSFEDSGLPRIVRHVLLEDAVGDALMFKQLFIKGSLQVGHIQTRRLFHVELSLDEIGIG